MRLLRVLVVSCLFAVDGSFGWAQQASTLLPEIVVTATRIATPTLEVPAFTTVIGADDIKSSPAADLSELLRDRAGLVVNSDGAAGAVSTASIRGSTSSEVLVLVNGVPLNSSRDGTVDLSQIPLSMISRVEIVRGGESSVYGTNAVGGIVNIITKKPGRTASMSVKIENGGYLPHAAMVVSQGGGQTPVAADPLDLLDMQRLSLSGSGRLGRIGVAAAGGFTRAANGFVWNDSSYLGGWRRESHAGGLSGNGYLDVSAPFGAGTVSVTGTLTSSAFDVPGSLDPFGITSHAEQQRTVARGTVGYASEQKPADRFGVKADGYYQFDLLHYADPSAVPITDSTHRTNTAGGELSSDLTVTDLLSLNGGASTRYDALSSSDVGQRSRLDVAGFVSATYSATPKLSLTPSARYDYFTDIGGGFSYRLGTVYAINSVSSLKASLSRSFRVPTMNDLYWPSSPYAMGNPALKPESALAGDFGYSVRTRALSLDCALFSRYVTDQIIWAPTGDPVTSPWTPTNLGRTLIPGIELNGKIQFLNGFSFSASYSFIYSFLLTGAAASYSIADNKRVPYVPINTLAAELGYKKGGAHLSVEGRYVGREYTDDGNTLSAAITGHAVFNLRYLQQLGKSVGFSLVLKNVLNSVYETQAGYPMPPFSFWSGIEVRL